MRIITYRAYGVVLWEISTYGETPLEDWEVQDIVNAAQKQRLEHTRLNIKFFSLDGMNVYCAMKAKCLASLHLSVV